MPALKKLWLNDSRPHGGNNVEIRFDWDNDRHHAVRIDPPFGRDEVERALESSRRLILRDHKLK